MSSETIFVIEDGRTLILERMILKGATSGSVEIKNGGNIIAFDSTWERNENLDEDGKGDAVYSDGISGVHLIYSKFLMNTAQRDGGACISKARLALIVAH